MRKIPGPGDPETWGPCMSHPGDPRTEDMTETPEWEDTKEQMTNERIRDLNGCLVESITEASDMNLSELAEAIIIGDALRVGDIVIDLAHRYCTPSDEDILKKLNL